MAVKLRCGKAIAVQGDVIRCPKRHFKNIECPKNSYQATLTERCFIDAGGEY